MEHDNANDNLPPQALCRMGCGFYGSQSFDGLCSKCYKDALKRKQNSSPVNVHVSPSTCSGGQTASSIGQGEKDSVAMNSVASALAQASLGQERSSNEPIPQSSHAPKVNASAHSLTPAVPTTPADITQSMATGSPTVSVPCSERTLATLDDATTCNGATGLQSSSSSSVVESPDDQRADKKPKRNRCHTCKKKVGLTGFACRCGGLFCSQHRYSDKHECSFDYRELGQEQIRRNNPVIKGDKLQKI